MAKPSHKPDDPKQSERFKALAREFGIDGDSVEFQAKLRAIAAAPRKAAVTRHRPKANKKAAPKSGP